MKRSLVLAAAACLLVLALAGPALVWAPSAAATSSPTVTAIQPAAAPNDQATSVVISGTGFASGATVTLGTDQLAVVSVSDTTIAATVPAGLVPGSYAWGTNT